MNLIISYRIFFICFFCFQLFSFWGCKSNVSPVFESSTLPTNEQLKNSRFANFITKLKSLPEKERIILIEKFLNDNSAAPIIEDSILACFYYYSKTSSVQLNGDMQYGWAKPVEMEVVKCGDENFFYKIYSLPSDARLDYVFNIDGKSIPDPRNSDKTPSGFGLHSQLAMPLFRQDPIRITRGAISKGTIDSITFTSKKSKLKPRSLKIYKPSEYDKLSNIPVLYVNDGFKAIEYSSFITIVDNLIADKKIRPLNIVFIEYIEGDSEYFLNETEEYLVAVCDELVPFIDKNYKTSHFAKDRVISGISAGGHVSLLTALKRPDIFLNAAGQSSTITTELLTALSEASLNEKYRRSLRFYFDVGRFDLISAPNNQTFLYANQKLRDQMKNLGFDYHFNIYNDGHQWANWRERADDILVYFFGLNAE